MAIHYPQFRKYKNQQGYFKLLSPTEWEEIKIVGNNHSLHQFTVKIMPDRNLLHDMTFDYNENWEAIREEEYEMIKKKIAHP